MHFTQQSRMPCFFYVTNSVYMEQKPETGKSTDKTKNACYTSTIKANEKEIREETIMVIRLFCAAGYQLGRAKEICEPKGVPVDVIPMQDYGMCNGMNVLKFAYKLAKNK